MPWPLGREREGALTILALGPLRSAYGVTVLVEPLTLAVRTAMNQRRGKHPQSSHKPPNCNTALISTVSMFEMTKLVSGHLE